MTADAFKAHFYSGSRFIHLNNSGQAPIPDVNRDVAALWLKRFYEEGALCAMEAWAQTEVTREKLAHFIGAEPDEVAFFQTTAAALSQAAFAIPLKAQDEILTWEQEYPSNFYPWRVAAERSGAKVVQVPSHEWQTPVQTLLDRVNERTRVVAISWVQYQTGSVTDLRALADALNGTGIWLVADVIQGAGVRPFAFADCGFDVVCGGSHKFLCSAYGAAFMAVKKARLEQMNPLAVGAMTYGDPDTVKSYSLATKSDASKLEPGSKAVVETIALGATVDLFSQFGIQNIFGEASRTAERLRAGLATLGCQVYSPEGPIVTFASKADLVKTTQALDQACVSYAKRGPGIRLSTHGFTRDSDIDRVLTLLEHV